MDSFFHEILLHLHEIKLHFKTRFLNTHRRRYIKYFIQSYVIEQAHISVYPCAFERQLAQMFCLGGSLNAAEHTENVPSAVALQISPSLLMFWTPARLPLLLALSLRPAWCYSCLSLWNASVLCKCWSSHCVLCVRVRACVCIVHPNTGCCRIEVPHLATGLLHSSVLRMQEFLGEAQFQAAGVSVCLPACWSVYLLSCPRSSNKKLRDWFVFIHREEERNKQLTAAF